MKYLNLLSVIFVVLMLGGVLDISLWVALLPTFIWLGLWFLVLILAATAAAISSSTPKRY